ncbi:MAG: M23 family metallopeptidase [Candidatus Latescibacterota bacterium]|nr:MAG: M23 family metallopeptidase [Candidatus Latescibacterota bacterium]
MIPVYGAHPSDWNRESFWHGAWGASGVHKGVDIFAEHGTPVLASTGGLILYRGELPAGGNVVLILGPRWRVHYYAHLDASWVGPGRWVRRGQSIGAVGNTGNAANTPSHLHYAVATLCPYPWRISNEAQGWKRMFYLDPEERLAGGR